VDGCNGGSRRRVRDPSLVETGVREVDGWMDGRIAWPVDTDGAKYRGMDKILLLN